MTSTGASDHSPERPVSTHHEQPDLVAVAPVALVDPGRPRAGSLAPSERLIVLIVAAVQFVNILDFMMVMPLGPDFALALGMPTSHVGFVGGSYTVSAAIAGMAGSFFLDRFDRRHALAVTMLGLVLATALGGLAVSYPTLIGARLLAGAFGGPATSVSLAIVSDLVPVARRGRAVGTVMMAFSVASILGVPAGLELATLLGWRAPFFAVAALGLLVTVAALALMPSLTGHRGEAREHAPRVRIVDRVAIASLTNTALVMIGVFAVIPNIATFLQYNLGYPREGLGLLYLVGGFASFLATRAVGSLVDRFGATRLIALGTVVFGISIYKGFVSPVSAEHVIWVFPLLMLSASLRGVPLNSLASRVPGPSVRARYMSAQSSVQHMASAAGAFLASAALDAEPSGRLIGMRGVAITAIVVALLVPFVSSYVERKVRERERAPVRA